MTHDRRVPWWVPIVLAGAISFGSMIYIEATHDSAAITKRLDEVEVHVAITAAHQYDTDQHLEHIEGKLDHLIEGMLGERSAKK